MNRAVAHDDRQVTHLLNLICGTVLTYAAVTRGALVFARGLAYLASRSS